MNAIIKLEEKLILKDNQSIYFVKIDDIIRCESESSYTTLFLNDGDEIVISQKIKEFEEILKPFGFIRVHQSHLVNKNKVKRFDRHGGGCLVFDNNIMVPVSQRKRDSVLKLLTKSNLK